MDKILATLIGIVIGSIIMWYIPIEREDTYNIDEVTKILEDASRMSSDYDEFYLHYGNIVWRHIQYNGKTYEENYHEFTIQEWVDASLKNFE